MSIGQLITEGVGSFGDVAHVVTDGLDIGAAPSTNVIATILTEGFGMTATASAFVVTDGFGSSTTPTPTPPPVSRGGGTSRKGRQLPQYYSRQFFGEKVQLPQDEVANEIAQDVLSQTAGVLEDLRDGAEFDALLQTVDQLARIAAMHVESRQIYNVIEQTRNRVQAKKDAEIKAYITAAIEEEDDVKEIMEFL